MHTGTLGRGCRSRPSAWAAWACPRATDPIPAIAANQALLNHVAAIAVAQGATPGQIALAWLLAQHPWIVPIPGTRRRERIAENTTATSLALCADEVADLNISAQRLGVRGERYGAFHMRFVES